VRSRADPTSTRSIRAYMLGDDDPDKCVTDDRHR
jgi:hypothetical protein